MTSWSSTGSVFEAIGALCPNLRSKAYSVRPACAPDPPDRASIGRAARNDDRTVACPTRPTSPGLCAYSPYESGSPLPARSCASCIRSKSYIMVGRGWAVGQITATATIFLARPVKAWSGEVGRAEPSPALQADVSAPEYSARSATVRQSTALWLSPGTNFQNLKPERK